MSIVIFRMVQILLKIVLLMALSGLGACDVDTDNTAVIPADTAVAVTGQDDQSGRYNILLILADDLGYDHYGFAGHPVVKTPSVNTLSTRSIRFYRIRNTRPLCEMNYRRSWTSLRSFG